jgi:hypothetical protein
MDIYVESAFGVALLAILLALGGIARRLLRIQRELSEWHREWKIAQHDNTASDKQSHEAKAENRVPRSG